MGSEEEGEVRGTLGERRLSKGRGEENETGVVEGMLTGASGAGVAG